MNNRKNRILTMILSLIGVIVFVVASVMVSRHFALKSEGQIQVKLIDLEGNITKEKEIEFDKGDTLQYLLEENFDNVVIENGMLMSIENFTTPLDWSTFISIYVDNEISPVGLLDIEFKDGTLISFVMTEFSYS